MYHLKYSKSISNPLEKNALHWDYHFVNFFLFSNIQFIPGLFTFRYRVFGWLRNLTFGSTLLNPCSQSALFFPGIWCYFIYNYMASQNDEWWLYFIFPNSCCSANYQWHIYIDRPIFRNLHWKSISHDHLSFFTDLIHSKLTLIDHDNAVFGTLGPYCIFPQMTS